MSTISEARLDANRRNAQHSTGPRSAAGKARSSQNGVTLGIYSKRLLLEGEDPQQLQLLRNGLVQSLQPSCAFEALLVERIISAAWKLQRLARGEQLLFLQGTVSRRNALPEEVREALKLPPREATMRDGMRMMLYPPLSQSLSADIMLAESNPVLEKLQKEEHKLENAILRWTKELRLFRKGARSGTPVDDDENGETEPTAVELGAEPAEAVQNVEVTSPTLQNRRTEPKAIRPAPPKCAALIAAATSAVSTLGFDGQQTDDTRIEDLTLEHFINGAKRREKARASAGARR